MVDAKCCPSNLMERSFSLKDEIFPDVQSRLGARSGIELFLLLSYGVIVLIAAYQLTRFSLNHDVGEFLLDIRELREGRPYADANMPSNLWLPYISFFIAEYVPFYLADIHQAVLFTFAILCVTLVVALLKSHDKTSLIRFAAILGLPSILLLLPGYHFGQREHLFALSCAPLLVLQYNRCAGIMIPLALSILVACVAAFGASQKPFFIISLMGLGLIDLISKRFRSVSWEFLLIGALLAAYLCWINITYPTYFLGMLPGALKTLGAMRLPLMTTLALAFIVPILTIKLLFLNIGMFGFSFHMDEHKKAIIFKMFFCFIAISILAWLGAVVQRFCFDYHFIPFKLFVAGASIIIFAWLIQNSITYAKNLGCSFRGKVAAYSGFASVLVYILVLLSQLTESSRLELYRREVLEDSFTKVLQGLPPRTPILMLSSRVTPITPIHAYADIRWTGTFLNLLSLLPVTHALAHTDGHDLPLIEEEAKSFRQTVTDSFKNPSPEFVFVDVSKVFSSFVGYDHPDILAFMSGSADFQKLWLEYQKVGHINSIYGQELDVYQKK